MSECRLLAIFPDCSRNVKHECGSRKEPRQHFRVADIEAGIAAVDENSTRGRVVRKLHPPFERP
ncbi:MAG: hypothetical protein OXF31_07325 [Gammaproteobacteria bacterium]|nr:hypothetical protein [Gammaproteobacteria bacterium]